MRIKLIIIILIASGYITTAQENTQTLSMSLIEAQEYALLHNKTIKASKLDIEVSKMAKWDAISTGLPSLKGSASLSDNLKIMTTLLPGEILGKPGTYVPVQFGQKFNTGYGIEASQLLFNASYFVGIKTAELARGLSVKNLEKSELDNKESVAQTYYLILASEKSLDVLNDNISNLNEVMQSTKARFDVGMAEATDIDQIKSNITSLENSKKSIERNIELSYNLMRFQLGLDTNAEIKLTQTLDDFIEDINVQNLALQNFNLSSSIDYRLFDSQEKMGELSVKMQKAAVLPSLVGFYTYAKSGQGTKLDGLSWFPNSMIGLQLNVPIFASGQRYSRIRKAQLELQKTQTNKSLISDQLNMQAKQLKYNLINANEQFISRKDNIDVANRVYVSIENKYKQGMASSLELTQAHNNYLSAISDYTSSIINLLQTKLALDKLMNTL